MTKGTTSRGERGHHSHTLCRRCGNRSFHTRLLRCASCSFPNPRMRRYHWSVQAIRRRTTGAGRMRYLKDVQRKASNGFREGTVAKRQVAKKQ
eukprot:TRINITY_DN180_c0_g1_i2.p2 TRINITY_DN180_c0_g1~~TRINITY_DN180_c0_g1_i2.p2  ORF type:complete len:105 (+),score=21.58 TRINITY_DN180_c0_g1_i2:38-316(+)